MKGYHFWKSLAVKIVVWGCTGVGIYILFTSVRSKSLTIYDAILLGAIFVALAIAVTFSNSYSERLGDVKRDGGLMDIAIRHDSTFLHASFCWNVVHYFLAIAPLYCTCVVIYLSGFTKQDSSQQVLLYSILSLVLSTSAYAIHAKGFAMVYRNASKILNDAIMEAGCDPKRRDEILIGAMKEAEEAIRQYEADN